MQIGLSLITLEPICAVKMRDGNVRTGRIASIPRAAKLKTTAVSALPDMIEVEWLGQRFAAFEVDLEQRCCRESRESPVRLWRWTSA